MSNKTDFGYTQVDKHEKATLVKGVFDNVAADYDVMNDLMSLGVHRLWKDRLIEMMNSQKGAKLLDVAGGTGDVAFRFLKQTAGGSVTVCDINESMLKEGQKNAIDKNVLSGVEWVCGDAENLPFEDNSYDFYTIAFGIRNVTNKDKALLEAKRVLKPGGRFLCLEFSKVNIPPLAKLYDFFSFNVIPKIGEIIAKDGNSYRYLVESIRKFPNQEIFANMIKDAGFQQVKYVDLSGGIVAIHSGWKV